MNALTNPQELAERRWAAGVHVAALILAFLTSWAAGIAGMVAAAVVILLKPANGSAFVELHAKEAFNFNLSMFLYMLIAYVLAFVTLGIGLLVILPVGLVFVVVWLVCSIKAAMRANDGLTYRYPLTFRLWQ